MSAKQPIDVRAVVDGAPLGALPILVLVLTFTVTMLDGYDLLCLSFVAPALAKAWHIAPAALGPVFGVSYAGVIVGGLIIGPLSDVLGRKGLLLACLLIFGLTSLAPIFDVSYERLMLYRFVVGVGLGGALSSAAALTAEYAPLRRRNLFVSLMFGGVATGGVVGGFLASRLIPEHGWQAAFWIGGLAPLALLPVVWLCMPESIVYLARKGQAPARIAAILNRIDPRGQYQAADVFVIKEAGEDRAGDPRALLNKARASATLLVWLVSFCALFAFGLVVSWLPSIMTAAGHALRIGILGPVALNLGGVVGTILLGAVLGRRAPTTIIGCGLALAAIAAAVLGQAIAATAAAFTAILLLGLFLLGSINATNALVTSFYPTAIRATGVGWALGVGRMGGVLGPMIGGLMLGARQPPAALFHLAAAVALVGGLAALALGIFSPDRQRSTPLIARP